MIKRHSDFDSLKSVIAGELVNPSGMSGIRLPNLWSFFGNRIGHLQTGILRANIAGIKAKNRSEIEF